MGPEIYLYGMIINNFCSLVVAVILNHIQRRSEFDFVWDIFILFNVSSSFFVCLLSRKGEVTCMGAIIKTNLNSKNIWITFDNERNNLYRSLTALKLDAIDLTILIVAKNIRTRGVSFNYKRLQLNANMEKLSNQVKTQWWMYIGHILRKQNTCNDRGENKKLGKRWTSQKMAFYSSKRALFPSKGAFFRVKVTKSWKGVLKF